MNLKERNRIARVLRETEPSGLRPEAQAIATKQWQMTVRRIADAITGKNARRRVRFLNSVNARP